MKDVSESIVVLPFLRARALVTFTLSFFEGRDDVMMNEKTAIGCDVWEASAFLTSRLLWRTTNDEQASTDCEWLYLSMEIHHSLKR